MGDGNHASVTKSYSSSSWPKMRCWCQPPGEPGPQKSPPFSPSSILEARNCSQNWYIDTNSIAVLGTLRLFWPPVCTVCVLLVAGYNRNTHLFTRNLTLRNLREKCWRWNLTFRLLDTGTSASFIIHGAQKTSAMSHLPNAQIGFTSLLYVHTHRARTNTQHWLSCPSLQRKQFLEALSAARFSSCQIECHAIELRRTEHRGTRVPGMVMLPVLPTKRRKQAWMAAFNVLVQGFLISTQELSGGFSTQMQKWVKTLAKIKKVKT